MKHFFVLIICIGLLASCSRPKVDVYPTGSHDTLGIQWMSIEKEHILFFFQGTGATAASIYADQHEDAYTQIDRFFQAQPPGKLRYFVWTDWAEGQKLINIPSQYAGYTFASKCECHVKGNMNLGHEMTHVLSYWAWGIEPASYSKFITEGIAVAFDLRGDDKLERAKTAVKGKIVNLVDVWQGNYDTDEDVLYPLGGAFVDYLYKNTSVEKFKLLIKHRTYEDAQIIYGKDNLDAIIRDFNSKMGL